MQPLILLVTMFFLLILPLGWWTALRVALTATFLLTASAHCGRKRRDDLIRGVRAALPPSQRHRHLRNPGRYRTAYLQSRAGRGARSDTAAHRAFSGQRSRHA